MSGDSWPLGSWARSSWVGSLACGGKSRGSERDQAIADGHVLAKIQGSRYEGVRAIGGGFWVIRTAAGCFLLEIDRFHLGEVVPTGVAVAHSC